MRFVLAAVFALAAGPALAACNTAAPQLCDPTQMKVIWINPLGAVSSAIAINDSGAVIGSYSVNTGTSQQPSDTTYSFEWTQGGGLVTLPDTFGAVDINAAGEIAGDTTVAVVGKKGTLYYNDPATLTNGAISVLVKPNEVAKGAGVIGITKSGAVLGEIGEVPTIWTKGRPAAVVGLPAGATNLGMNNAGEFIGTAAGGSFTLIGGKLTYAAAGTEFYAVNDKGNVTGSYAKDPKNGPFLVMRDINGVVRDSKPFADCLYSVGTAINSANMIVGYCTSGKGPHETLHSFLMEPTGVAFDLTALYGFTPSYGPHAINSSGWIVGTVGSRAVVLVWK